MATLPPPALRFSPSEVIAAVETRSPVILIGPPPPPPPSAWPLPPREEMAPVPTTAVALSVTAPPLSPLPLRGADVASPASAVIAPSASEAPVRVTAPPCGPRAALLPPVAVMLPAVRAPTAVKVTGAPARRDWSASRRPVP